MPRITGRLVDGKPIIEVAIAGEIPAPSGVTPTSDNHQYPLRRYRALLDTGATITCLCNHVIQENSLRPYGLVIMTGGSGPNRHSSYIIRLAVICEEQREFEGELETTRSIYQLPDVLEAAAIQDNSWFDVIIGTDVISQYDLAFTRGGHFSFMLG